MYYVVLVIFLAGFWLIYRTIHSPFGQVLKAIRENEPRALSLGYDVDRYKLLAFRAVGGAGRTGRRNQGPGARLRDADRRALADVGRGRADDAARRHRHDLRVRWSARCSSARWRTSSPTRSAPGCRSSWARSSSSACWRSGAGSSGEIAARAEPGRNSLPLRKPCRRGACRDALLNLRFCGGALEPNPASPLANRARTEGSGAREARFTRRCGAPGKHRLEWSVTFQHVCRRRHSAFEDVEGHHGRTSKPTKPICGRLTLLTAAGSTTALPPGLL